MGYIALGLASSSVGGGLENLGTGIGDPTGSFRTGTEIFRDPFLKQFEPQAIEFDFDAREFASRAGEGLLGFMDLGEAPGFFSGTDQLSPSEADEKRQREQLAVIERAKQNVLGFQEKADVSAGRQRDLAGRIPFFDQGQLGAFNRDLLSLGAGGIPDIVETAFDPFAQSGRQAISEELAGKGLLTAGGASSTRGAEARGEFEARLAAAKAQQAGTLFTQFLGAPRLQGELTSRGRDIEQAALAANTLTLPQSLGLFGAEADIVGRQFSLQKEDVERDLRAMLGTAPILPGITKAQRGFFTAPTTRTTAFKKFDMPTMGERFLGGFLKGLGGGMDVMGGGMTSKGMGALK
jgi:hypothetical protein